MPLTRSLVLLLALLALPCALPAAAQKVITYEVDPHVQEKTYAVRMDIPHVRDLTLRLQLPVWSPGAYIAGNTGDTIADFAATDAGGKQLRTFRLDPNTWEVAANGANLVSVRYAVKNADLEEADGAPKRGHISGPRTYLYVVGRKAEPVALSLVAPPGGKVWNIATSLDPFGGPATGGTAADMATRRIYRFTAPNYDVLADAPVEMGDFVEQRFTAGGKPHRVVLYGKYANVDQAKLFDFCKRVAETETAFFGDVPFHQYVFMFRASGGSDGGAGGLEHLGSTEIGLRGIVDDRTRSVIAHEYFHLWNVKRIRPFVLGPFDYISPPHTANLWWCEGVTDYYAGLLSRRGGLNTDGEYWKHLADSITLLQNNPARLQVSADESSQRVWEANNSQGYGGLSYYTKGELVGLCLDLKIRQVTNGDRSLDDVIRALYVQCGRGEGPGFGEDDIKKTVNHISGHDLSDFYDTVARSTEELPLAVCLGYAGLKLAPSDTPEPVADLGLTLRPNRMDRSLVVFNVTPDGPAAKAGLKAGDRIVAINGQTDLLQMASMRGARPGTKFTLTLLRDGQKTDVDYTVGTRYRTPWLLTVDSAATPEQLRLRQQWLNGK